MYCPNCGAWISDGERFCQNCGYSTETRTAQREQQPQPCRQPQQVAPPSVEYRYVLPEENEPLSPWAYWGLGIVFTIPIVGLVCLIVLSFHNNINLRNYARSYWCALLVAVIVIIVLVATGAATYIYNALSDAAQTIISQY